jgi:type IV secretory pathway TraG/TraD family ATPase VirD4
MGGINFGRLLQQYNNPEGYLMLGLLVLLIGAAIALGGGKGKITTGRLAGTAERLSATGKALKQLRLASNYVAPKPQLKKTKNNQKQEGVLKAVKKPTSKPASKSKSNRKPIAPNRLTLWAGKMPQFWWGGTWRGVSGWLQTFFGSMPAVWIPDAQRSIFVVGSPGSGKTASAIDPMVESAFAQGIPVLLYDKKGDMMRRNMPLAARYGYETHLFAPGEKGSGTLNFLEFLKNPQDAVMAGELGAVINRNAREGQPGKSDEFFTKAGDLLAKALMQLAKSTPYPDIAMVYALLRLTNLVHRIDYAVQIGKMDEWIASSFIQFLSAKDAEKTISGILTTTAATFSGFIQQDLLGCFIGKSTIPTRIEGKQLIVFKLDDERRTVVGPLLAAALHLSVVKNLSTPRKDPIAIFLDELPSLRLDRLPQWINEYRSNGGCFVLGVQSLNQLYETYGEKMGDAIAFACATQMLFNPNDVKTAETYSKRYGEKEITHKSKSRSRNMGQQASTTTSWNESLQKMPLFTIDQILRFSEGQCILTNPGYRSGLEGSVPYHLKVPMPGSEIKRSEETTAMWESHIKPHLESQVPPVDGTKLMQGLKDRIALAEELLPLPPDFHQESGQTPNGGKQVQGAVVRKQSKPSVTQGG